LTVQDAHKPKKKKETDLSFKKRCPDICRPNGRLRKREGFGGKKKRERRHSSRQSAKERERERELQ